MPEREDCYGCFGEKTVPVQDPKTGKITRVTCPACGGTGKR